MKFQEFTAKIPVHPQATETKEDLRPRLEVQLGYLLAQHMTKVYGEELTLGPANFADYFVRGFNDVQLKVEVPILSPDEVAALRKNPRLIEEDIDEGRVVVP